MIIDNDEDGLTFALRVVEQTRLVPPPASLRSPKNTKAFDTGFNLAKRIIAGEIKDERDRRLKRMIMK